MPSGFFQYFTIAPMRGLSFGKGIIAAIKADTLSLTAWQLGMYGFMALAYFYFFGVLLGVKLQTNMVEFWFMMQLAMVCGFLTSYPVNWWLIQSGMKRRCRPMNLFLTIVLMLGLAACSSPAATTNGQASIKGYGVAAVAGDGLIAMLARCSQSGSQVADAHRRSLLNPGREWPARVGFVG